ncbi:hypothetical protein ACFWVP_30820 [Streptomyces sp. NPDC058637]|uniref:hypothetical protein n=1 Tax=Streptomyces sp. NPDC058637 TaxID=3346569 RepID=UPI003668F38B
MPVISGRFAEARLYLYYCVALFHPGRTMPTFAEPEPHTRDILPLSDDELTLLIEEGRRQLDRQMADMDRIRTRAGALATVALALTAAVVSKLPDVLQRHWTLISLWGVSCALAFLAVAGAASILSARAVLGRIDTRLAAQGLRPLRSDLAEAYVELVSTGEETVRTFLTVFRDAVTLVVVAALVFFTVLGSIALSTTSPTPMNGKEKKCQTSTSCSAPLSPK